MEAEIEPATLGHIDLPSFNSTRAVVCPSAASPGRPFGHFDHRRRRNEASPEAARSSAAGRDDSRYWLAGLIYFNPSDPALLVRKRFGFGRTLNFGHWVSWAIMAVLLSVPLLARFVVGHPGHH